MRIMTQALFQTPMAVLLWTGALASTAVDAKDIPFNGSLQGEETYEFEGASLLSHGTGSGNASELGLFTATWETVSHPNEPVNNGSTRFNFISANGDSVFMVVAGQAKGSYPLFKLTETGIITGGTGRFEGATGSFAVERGLTVTSSDSGTTSGSFNGILSVNPRPAPTLVITVIPTGVHCHFTGTPGQSYRIESAAALTGPWTTLTTPTVPPNGVVDYLDPQQPVGTTFYRTREL